MKYIFLIIAIAYTLMCFGCRTDAQSSVQSGNFKVEFLFEQNGCKVYRFFDGGRAIYWSDCTGKMSETHSTKSGKTRTTHHMESLTN